MRRSLQASLIALFAALHAVLYLTSFGLWRNWGIYLEVIEGIILGPQVGFAAAFLGSSIGRIIRPDAFWMFGIIAEPFSVLIAGLLARARWKPVVLTYGLMLSAYFAHAFGRELPVWAIADVLLAFALIYPVSRLSGNLFKRDVKRLSVALALLSFVCVSTDALVRIFLLVPCGLYGLFFDSFGALYATFAGAAVDSFVEDAIVVIISLVAGVPVLIGISKLKIITGKEKEKV